MQIGRFSRPLSRLISRLAPQYKLHSTDHIKWGPSPPPFCYLNLFQLQSGTNRQQTFSAETLLFSSLSLKNDVLGPWIAQLRRTKAHNCNWLASEGQLKRQALFSFSIFSRPIRFGSVPFRPVRSSSYALSRDLRTLLFYGITACCCSCCLLDTETRYCLSSMSTVSWLLRTKCRFQSGETRSNSGR